MTAPSLTVAIPTYNGARHIDEAVQSILAQDATFSLVVSDDRSSDDTVNRIRRIAGDRARIEINSERLGLADNWNRCVALSQTPFVAIFHQDDAMHPGHLTSHLAGFTEGVGLVASASGVIDSNSVQQVGNAIDPGGCGPSNRTYLVGEFLRELAVANPLRCSAVTLRVEAHRAANGFARRFRYVVDWDLWIKVAQDWGVAWLGRPSVSVRWHASSETHTFKTGVADLEETSALIDALLSDHPELGSFRRDADRRLARAYLNRAYEAAKAGLGPLCRKSLRRAIALRPAIVGQIVADPRLAVRLALGSLGALGRRG